MLLGLALAVTGAVLFQQEAPVRYYDGPMPQTLAVPVRPVTYERTHPILGCSVMFGGLLIAAGSAWGIRLAQASGRRTTSSHGSS